MTLSLFVPMPKPDRGAEKRAHEARAAEYAGAMCKTRSKTRKRLLYRSMIDEIKAMLK